MPGGSHYREPRLSEETIWLASAALAARAYGVRLPKIIDIQGRQTRAIGEVLLARRAALYLASVGANQSSRSLCRATGLDRKTIRYHLAALEDARETRLMLDALFDELADRLQGALARTIAGEPEPRRLLRCAA